MKRQRPLILRVLHFMEIWKDIDGFEGIQNKLLVKQCALICVDEQIKSLKKYEQFETFELHKELLKVKQHLNNL